MALAAAAWMAVQPAGLAWARILRREELLADLGWGLMAGLALAASWSLARRVLPAATALERQLALALGPLSRAQALALALVSGLAEELLFRGAMLTSWGVVASTLLFAVLHLSPPDPAAPRQRPSLVWITFAVVAGASFAALVSTRQVLLPAVVAHIAVNAIGIMRLTGLYRGLLETPDAA